MRPVTTRSGNFAGSDAAGAKLTGAAGALAGVTFVASCGVLGGLLVVWTTTAPVTATIATDAATATAAVFACANISIDAALLAIAPDPAGADSAALATARA